MIAIRIIAVMVVLGCASGAQAADSCQDFVKLKDLPTDFRLVSQSAIGPAKLSIKSNGNCTCNDLPAAQRSLGEAQLEGGVNFACEAAEAADTKGK